MPDFPVTDAALSNKLPASLGPKAASASLSVVLASDGADPIQQGVGAPVDAVATSDTGSFSLVALTKRILQKLTTLITVNDGTKGVTVAENIFAADDTNKLIIAADPARRRLIITNPSANTVRLGITTSNSATYAQCPIILVPGESWVESTAAPIAWRGILESGSANVPYQAVV